MLPLPMPPAANKMFTFSRTGLSFVILSTVAATIGMIVGLEKKPTDAGEWEVIQSTPMMNGGGAHFNCR